MVDKVIASAEMVLIYLCAGRVWTSDFEVTAYLLAPSTDCLRYIKPGRVCSKSFGIVSSG